jgi:CubicO group peptidase (beta-lactamase class C family)
MDRQYSVFSRLSKWHFRAGFWAIALALMAGTCSAQAPAERMQQVVQPFADAQMFMGSVLVAQHGKVLFSKSYGSADLEWNIPNSPTTRFNIASMTKQFTAAAILLLEDRGKLRTDDPITKYFPDAPSPWDKITIYNLLTHTSGISDNAGRYTPGTPDSLVLLNKPLNFQPGEKWSYVNMGYLILGYLIEKISGQTYAEFLHENIFKPLGMNDSGLDSNVTVIPRRAIGYWPGASGIENAERPNLAAGFSAGSLYSSAEDLLRWEEGLFGGKLLRAASLRKMTTPFRSDYACGVHVSRVSGRLMVEHGGNNIGFNAGMAYYPEERLAVIVLANLNGTVTGKITTALAAVAHGETVTLPPPPKAITLPKEILASYAGTYQFTDYTVEMKVEGTQLIAVFDDGPSIVFFTESETKFFDKTWGIELEFSKDENGKVVYVTRHQEGRNEKGTKK